MAEGDLIDVWLNDGRNIFGMLLKQGRESIKVECRSESGESSTVWTIWRTSIAAIGKVVPSGQASKA